MFHIVIETTWTTTLYRFQCPDYFGFYARVTAWINIDYSRSPIIIDYHFFIITSCLFSLCCFKKLFRFSTASLCFFPFAWFVIEEHPLEDNSIILWHTEQQACITLFDFAHQIQPSNKGSSSQASTKYFWFFLLFFSAINITN